MFLHRPPCLMANTKPSMPTSLELVQKMQKRSQEFHILHLIVKALKNSSLPDTDFVKHSIFGNILVAQAMFTGFSMSLHIGRKSSVMIFKNFLLPMSCNAFDEQYHGLSLKNPDIVATRLRDQSRSVKVDPRSDQVFHVGMLNA